MNSAVEQLARKEYGTIIDPTKIRIRVKVSWVNGICLPDSRGKTEEEAIFKVLTFGDNYALDKAVSYEIEVDGGMGRVTAFDLNEYRRLLIKKNLLSWTLDIPIEREDGWMTPKCYERVRRIPGPLMDAFVDGFEQSSTITREEEEKIIKQSIILFGRNSRGVVDACEAISLFCTLGNFWEKFGVSKGVPIQEFPYKEYLMLKMVVSKENEAMRTQMAPRKPLTRIAGPGGRPMASRGIVVED